MYISRENETKPSTSRKRSIIAQSSRGPGSHKVATTLSSRCHSVMSENPGNATCEPVHFLAKGLAQRDLTVTVAVHAFEMTVPRTYWFFIFSLEGPLINPIRHGELNWQPYKPSLPIFIVNLKPSNVWNSSSVLLYKPGQFGNHRHRHSLKEYHKALHQEAVYAHARCAP